MSTSQPNPSAPDRLPDVAAGVGHVPPAAIPAGWIERCTPLDRVAPVLGWVTGPFARGTLGSLLRGEPLGHTLHPVLTDLPIGFWTSAVVLDVCGGTGSRDAARRLLGLGVLTAGPTAWSGWADWHRLPRPESRVGTVHALLNGTAIGLFAESWLARRGGRQGAGVAYAMAGSAVATAAGYLGGHLAAVRKAGYRDPAFDHDHVGPLLRRPRDSFPADFGDVAPSAPLRPDPG